MAMYFATRSSMPCWVPRDWATLANAFPIPIQSIKGMASLTFVTEVAGLLEQNGFRIENIDSNILAERPRLLQHFPAMRKKLAAASGIPIEKISIKAKTMEGLGVIGTEEAIAAEAIALVSFE